MPHKYVQLLHILISNKFKFKEMQIVTILIWSLHNVYMYQIITLLYKLYN
jgi:hypothetical protein